MVNSTILIGRITKDVEVNNTQSGSSVCNFTLAINRTFKNQNGEYDADFINCVAFNQTATLMEQYVAKGQLLSVQGRLQSRSYEDNTGRKVYVTEVVVNNVSFLEKKEQNNNTYEDTNVWDHQSEETSIDDDDLPF